jgi:hypothetical protein
MKSTGTENLKRTYYAKVYVCKYVCVQFVFNECRESGFLSRDNLIFYVREETI